jgi:dTDP-4-dehydrorhamnose reductase
MNRVSLALKVLQYFPKAQHELFPQATETLNQPAKRPLYGGFIPSKFLSEFPEFLFNSVDNYLENYKKKH